MALGVGLMARIKNTFSDGINEYLQTLNRLGKEIEGISKQAIYEGAKIIADEIKNNIEALPTDEEWGTPKKMKAGPTKAEKENIARGLGIAHMQDNKGTINTKIGYDDAGYDENNKPIQMIARSVNSGTSFMKKNPFFEKGVRNSRNKAKQKMIEVAEKELEKIAKEKE